MSSQLYLYEELMLLALKDEEGTTNSSFYSYAIGGAVIAELSLMELIEVEGEGRKAKLTGAANTRTGDPILDEWLRAFRESKRTRTLMDWVGRIARSKELKHVVARQLVRRGIVRATEDQVLWLFTRHVYPEVDPAPERKIIERLRTAIFEDGPVEPRSALIIALSDKTGLLRAVFGRKELKPRKDRLKKIAEGQESVAATEAATAAVAAAQAAVIAATTAATTAATVAASG